MDIPVPQDVPPVRVLSGVQTLRSRARMHIEQGAVTPGYGAERETVLELLGESDPTTRGLLKEILASEEEHAEDLSSLLEGMANEV